MGRGLLGVLGLGEKEPLTPDDAAAKIAGWKRRWLPHYVQRKRAAITIQRGVRAFVARRFVAKTRALRKREDRLREWYYALLVQRVWRGRRVYRRMRVTIMGNRIAHYMVVHGLPWLRRKQRRRQQAIWALEDAICANGIFQAHVRGWLQRKRYAYLKERARVNTELKLQGASLTGLTVMHAMHAMIIDACLGKGASKRMRRPRVPLTLVQEMSLSVWRQKREKWEAEHPKPSPRPASADSGTGVTSGDEFGGGAAPTTPKSPSRAKSRGSSRGMSRGASRGKTPKGRRSNAHDSDDEAASKLTAANSTWMCVWPHIRMRTARVIVLCMTNAGTARVIRRQVPRLPHL